MIEKSETPLNTENWKELPEWMHAHAFYYKDLATDDPMVDCAPNKANLVSSWTYSDGDTKYHTPVLDLDIDARLIPSTTPGHHHLIINKVMPQEDYDKLIRVMVEVGILQKGILELQWEKEGITAIRLPGVKKAAGEKSSGGSIAKPYIFTDAVSAGYLPTATIHNTNIQSEGATKHKNADLNEYTSLVKASKGSFNKENLPLTEVIDGYFYFLDKKHPKMPEVDEFGIPVDDNDQSKVEKKIKAALKELIEEQANDASEKPNTDPWGESPF